MNVASRLKVQAESNPEQIAIASAMDRYKPGQRRNYRTISLRDLDARSSVIAAGFQSIGIGPGKRIGLLVRFGEDFITLVFALLKAGATMVLVDPGMGRKNLIKCLEATQPDGFVAIPMAHAIVKVLSSRFPKAKLNVMVGPRIPFLPSMTLSKLEANRESDYRDPIQDWLAESAIIFTTGSTGPPKGVLYSHKTFLSQIKLISNHYQIERGGMDLSCFPLFGLFNAVMGTTTILPDMDPTRPADVDPPRLLDAIDHWQINQSFGSPALWNRLGQYCEQTGRKVPSLTRVLSAGAPVPPNVMQRMRNAIHPEAMFFTPYGATEALPIASIESRTVLGETAAITRSGGGTCVGNRFSSIEWRVIKITDSPLTNIDEVEPLPPGEIGELVVSGPVISERYVTRTDQNVLHKVNDAGRVWHRMGDVGYLDSQDRFWFCGRKSHRVQTKLGTIYTEPIEGIANTNPNVYRSALVGTGTAPNQTPLLILEPSSKQSAAQEQQVVQDVQKILASNRVSQTVKQVVVYPTKLPTDIRHNSKIFREQLTEWANKKTM
ncbi:MAG: fatty acid CoA ligase family protein [Pirellula sp.]|jgi:acyl-CoA synthetase (AMP-forming)/AMP-acid ligase II